MFTIPVGNGHTILSYGKLTDTGEPYIGFAKNFGQMQTGESKYAPFDENDPKPLIGIAFETVEAIDCMRHILRLAEEELNNAVRD